MKSNSTREKDSLSTTETYGFIGFILTYIALNQTVDIDEWGCIAKAIFSGVILMFVIFGWSVGFSFLGIIALYWFSLRGWMIVNPPHYRRKLTTQQTANHCLFLLCYI